MLIEMGTTIITMIKHTDTVMGYRTQYYILRINFHNLITNKGVAASYQNALSEEYIPLERVKLVLTWSRGCPGHDKMVSDDQKPRRFHKV